MLNLPPIMIDLLNPFAPCFYGVTTWAKAQVLLLGAILTPGKRVVTEALRVMGLSSSEDFAQYHQVLNRAVWSPLELAQALLNLLVKTFVPADEVLVFGIDPTIERRWGRKITARGTDRDPVRSIHVDFKDPAVMVQPVNGDAVHLLLGEHTQASLFAALLSALKSSELAAFFADVPGDNLVTGMLTKLYGGPMRADFLRDTPLALNRQTASARLGLITGMTKWSIQMYVPSSGSKNAMSLVS